MRSVWKLIASGAGLAGLCLGLSTSCIPSPTNNVTGYANTTDPTNNGASYIGSSACRSCHTDIAELDALHGHGQALKMVTGSAPSYPAGATRAGVPVVPNGMTFMDVSYLQGGYTHNAFYIDTDGYILTDGVLGAHAQYVLEMPGIGRTAGLAEYLPEVTDRKPFSFECIRCHTVGPQPVSAENPMTQDNRPGIEGTWIEAGVQCEACHGPGSKHVGNTSARNLFVDTSIDLCQRCHLSGDDANVVAVSNGFVASNTQVAELKASGGHASFDCGYCHDPHTSVTYDRERALRNACTSCHSDMNMAAHEGAVFTRGDYTEVLSCESCHMPYAGLSGTAAPESVVGPDGHVGDIRSHVFRIVTNVTTMAENLNADSTALAKDAQGRAGITVDVVCARCHGAGATEENSAFEIDNDLARQIAGNLHTLGAGQ